MEFLQQNPFVRLSLPLIAGILLGYFVPIHVYFFYLPAACSLLLLLGHWLTRKGKHSFRFRWMFGVSLHFVLFGIAVWITTQQLAQAKIDFPSDEICYRVRIADAPEGKERSVLCNAVIERAQYDTLHRLTDSRVILYFEKNERSDSLQRGDILLIKTTFTSPTKTNNPGNFDYANYLLQQGIAATNYIPSEKWKKIKHERDKSLIALAQKSQQYLLSIYKKYGISGDEFGVLSALTLGYKESLDPDLQASYSGSGAMHILAVSGLHVGIIYIVLNFILSFVFRKKKTKVLSNVFILIFLWLYAFITGLTPSVLRATIMFSFVVVGNCFRSKSPTYNRIAASAFLLLLFNPLLLFSVGFRLSYCAVIAIIYFQPKISNLLYFKSKSMRWLWELTSVSIAAQIGTAPWALLYFNQFTNYFLLTNIVAIPMASIIIYTAIPLFVFAKIDCIAQAIAALLNVEVNFLNSAVISINQLPHSVSEIAINNWQMALLFGTIILFSAFCEKRKSIYLSAGLCFLLVFSFTHIHKKFCTMKSKKLIVYADNKNAVVQQTYGIESEILTSDPEKIDFLTHNFSLRNKLNISKIVTLSETEMLLDNCFMFDGKRYMLIHRELSLPNNIKCYAEIDCLLLGKIRYTDIEKLLAVIHTKEVILLSSFPYWKTEETNALCTKNNITLYDMSKQGAWSAMADLPLE